MKIKKILIVTHDFHKAEALAARIFKFFGVESYGCFRDYHFEEYVKGGNPPDMILSDGTCKTRDDRIDGSFAITFSPREELEKMKVKISVLPIFLWPMLFFYKMRKPRS